MSSRDALARFFAQMSWENLKEFSTTVLYPKSAPKDFATSLWPGSARNYNFDMNCSLVEKQ